MFVSEFLNPILRLAWALKHSGQIFTCNNVASQRGESVNSSIKEKGLKKSELRSFNLYQLGRHIFSQFDRMEAKSLNSLCNMVSKNMFMTPYVEKIWMQQYQQATNLPFVENIPTQSEKWAIYDCPELTRVLHDITLKNSSNHDIPTCTCNAFCSTLIPCAGICAVFGRLQEHLFNSNNLHPRWRINNHPLYKTCLKKMKLLESDDSDPKKQTFAIENDQNIQAEVDLTAYNSILFPSRRDVRYSKFNQACKRIELRVIDNEHTYKIFLLMLANFEQSLHDNDEIMSERDDARINVPVLPPRRRGAASGEDINRSFCSFYTFFFQVLTLFSGHL